MLVNVVTSLFFLYFFYLSLIHVLESINNNKFMRIRIHDTSLVKLDALRFMIKNSLVFLARFRIKYYSISRRLINDKVVEGKCLCIFRFLRFSAITRYSWRSCVGDWTPGNSSRRSATSSSMWSVYIVTRRANIFGPCV